MRVPPLRNLYRRQGFEATEDDSLKAGFGLSHDGHVPGLKHQVDLDTFAVPEDLQDDLVVFLHALDTGTPPATGYQLTLDESTVGSPELLELPVLEQLAVDGKIDVIAKGTFQGEHHGFLFDPFSDSYSGDMLALGPFTRAELEAFAQSGDATLVFTGVPAGAGVRMGVDRDADGALDGDEGVVPYGQATAPCAPEASITANSDPYVGNGLFALVGESEAHLLGVAVVGIQSAHIPILGAQLLVDPTGPALFLSVIADNEGLSLAPLPIPDESLLVGNTVFTQFLWLASCPPFQLTSSAGLALTIQG